MLPEDHRKHSRSQGRFGRAEVGERERDATLIISSMRRCMLFHEYRYLHKCKITIFNNYASNTTLDCLQEHISNMLSSMDLMFNKASNILATEKTLHLICHDNNKMRN